MKMRPSPSRCFTSALVAVFALFCSSPGFSQDLSKTFGSMSESSNEPIDIESEVLTIYPEQYATFSGNVKAVQGTTTLRARELKVDYVGGGKATPDATKQVESAEPGTKAESVGESPANKASGVEPVAGGVEPVAGDGESVAGGGESAQPAAIDKASGKPETPTQPSQVTSPAKAQSARSIEDPIDIKSDWLLINDEKKYAQFKGNVKVNQGNTRLHAAELTVSYAGGGDLSASARMQGEGAAAQITKMEARGEVRAQLVPTGSAKPRSPRAMLADAKAGNGAPRNAAPREGKPAAGKAATTSSDGTVDVASAGNQAPETAQTASGNEQSEPASAGTKAPAATAQDTAAPRGTPVTAGDGSGRDSNRGITKIEAKGDVVITSEKNETTSSDWVVYDLPLQLVTIGGNVLLTQNENVLKGDRLVVDLKTGETRFENQGDGSAGGGRIRALFLPKGSKSENADNRDGAAKKPEHNAAPSQPAQESTIESREPQFDVPEYR